MQSFIITIFIPDVGLVGAGVPWSDATLARIPEKQSETAVTSLISSQHQRANQTNLLCTVGNCAALAMASLEMERGDPFTPVYREKITSF